jgi:fatty acid desaturase
MTQTTSEYEQARTRALRKRKFRGDLVAYVVINVFLVGIWAFSGAGYFWPGWVLAGWGVLLILDGWETFRRGVTEEDIQRELHKTP